MGIVMSKCLDALANIKREKPTFFSAIYDGGMWEEDVETIEKELKALEIIKKKKVDTRALIAILKEDWTWEDYMREEDDVNTGGHQFSNIRLTQEEYDLLKEELELL